MEQSGLTEIIPSVCISALWGQHPLTDSHILSSLPTSGSGGSWWWQPQGWWLPAGRLCSSWAQSPQVKGRNPWWLWQPSLLIRQEIPYFVLGWDLFVIINSFGKKLFLLQNWLWVMSCRFLGLLSDLGKTLSSFFQHMSYKVSGHVKCFCAVSHLNMKDAHSTHFWGPSRALDGTCVSEGCWGLSFNISW